jgi:ribonucleoside-diphosphate reductase alpha chain
MSNLQVASLDIWESKYQLKDKNGYVIELSPSDTLERVAIALASVEKPKLQKEWARKFLWALENGAVPAGRILSNAGAEKFKPATSLINCTVSSIVNDSMDGILGALHEAGLTLKAGCGIGYEFSTLRPKGSFVSGAGAYTSGALSFMDIYDKMCFTVSSAGGRRGAQMATFDISHPDVLDFIKAKRENGRLRQFNLSCLITKEFMDAVNADADWQLVFPVSKKELDDADVFAVNLRDAVWKKIGYATGDNLVKRENGEILCRVYKTIKARRLWDAIMSSTYDFAEPGFILIDAVNEMNNNWFCENIRATNPCGEQPLPPYGACLLGSINLTKFVNNPFTDKASFDWDRYSEVVGVFTRMLDNVVEINGLPLPQQQEELSRKRRHGMGFFGLGSALAMLCKQYGSAEAITFTEEITRSMALHGLRSGVELAKEKGVAPIMEEVFVVTSEMLAKRPEMAKDGVQVGDKLAGKVLWAKYSRYIQKITAIDPELGDDLIKYGCRFTHHTSIAPTGTMALSVGNNASNGIEPSFAHFYNRNVIREGKKSKEKIDVFSHEFLLYRQLVDANATPESLPEYFKDASSVTPKEHVDMQAAAQKWVDSAISKTINVPTEIDFNEFKDIYLYAYEQGLKGCTTFRFNPEAFQGVLVTEKDLASTTYQFTLEDGSTVELKGNEEVEYDGELHTAANLYDALKENYYGR